MSLFSSYGLVKEVVVPWTQGQKSYQDVTILGLDYVILCRFQETVAFLAKAYKGTLELNLGTPGKKLTPLHIATICGNTEAAKLLLEAGADINAKDREGWTPMHHAALFGNQIMMALLIRGGAKDIRASLMDASWRNILKMTHPNEIKDDDPIRLEMNGRAMVQKEFYRMTNSQFVEEIRMRPDQLLDLWKKSGKEVTERVIFEDDFRVPYQDFVQHPKTHILKEVPFGGFGLFAKEAVKMGEVIGEYVGEYVTDDMNLISDTYVMASEVDAACFRSGIPCINDGFPKTLLVPVHNLEGAPQRFVFISSEDIAPGEQFTWDYGGTHEVKWGPYSEIHPKAVRDFVKSHDFPKLMRGLQNVTSVESAIVATQTLYVLQTPSVLFSMAMEGVIDDAKTRQILAFSLHSPLIRQGIGIGLVNQQLKDLADIVFGALNVERILTSKYPNVATLFKKAALEFPARFGIISVLVGVKALSLTLMKMHLDSELTEGDLLVYWIKALMPRVEAKMKEVTEIQQKERIEILSGALAAQRTYKG